VSAEINHGGSAFPHGDMMVWAGEPNGTGGGVLHPETPGMTLRDWFAGQALAGHLAFPSSDLDPRQASILSYAYADAMIAARNGGAE
jgi:hypothetical protein